MAITVSNIDYCYLPNGSAQISGLATPAASYNDATKEVMDISAYLSGTPEVVISASSIGYCMSHNCGTAAAAHVTFYEAGEDAAVLDEVANGHDLSSAKFHFRATGTPV